VQILAKEELTVLQDRKAARERDRFLKEITEVTVTYYGSPVEPVNFIVLAVGVVVAALRTRELITPKNHGCSRSEQEITSIVLHQLLTQGQDVGIIRISFCTAVP